MIRIAIPTHDGRVHAETMFGVLSTAANAAVTVDRAEGSWLPANRDLLTMRFLQDQAATHLLFVDSDVGFRWPHVAALLALDVPFSFGLYARKDGSGRPTCATLEPVEGRDGVSTARWCGAGFVLLQRATVERMLLAYADDHSYLDEMGRQLVGLWQTPGFVERDGRRVQETEDAAFCRRWRETGGAIHTHRDVRLTHHGAQVYEVTV